MIETTVASEIWSLIKTYIDSKLAYEVAERYVELLVDNGMSDGELEEIIGNEKVLDRAINNYLADSEEDC